VLLLALLILAAGCGGPKHGPEVDLGSVPGIEAPIDEAEAEAPKEQAAEAQVGQVAEPMAEAVGDVEMPERPPYRMRVGDKLLIRFFYYPGYNLEVFVRSDGVVTIPSLGEVRAEGMTPRELEDIIRTHYAQILAEPTVSVIVQQPANEQVFVLGEVRTPRAVDYTAASTVMQLIASAGGVTTAAKKNSVILIRRRPEGDFGGTKLNLEDVLDGRAADVDLLPRDVVYVPMSSIARVDLFVNQFFQEISPVLYFYITGSEIFDPEGKFFIGR
jgi:polysaccharide export outer membrane protein